MVWVKSDYNFGIFYLIIFFNEILQSLHQVKLQINLYILEDSLYFLENYKFKQTVYIRQFPIQT